MLCNWFRVINTLAYPIMSIITAVKSLILQSWGKCCKTFYGCKLRLFYNKLVTGKRFQPSLMFAGKAGAYPSEAPLRCSALG